MAAYERPQRAVIRGAWLPDSAGSYSGFVTSNWSGGWEVLFPRAAAEAVVRDQAALAVAEEADALLSWDGDTVVVTYPDAPGAPQDRIEPQDVEGERCWDLSLGWGWYPDEVLGDDPMAATAQQRAAVKALAAMFPDRSPDGQLDRFGFLARTDGTHEFAVHVPAPPRPGDAPGTRRLRVAQIAAVDRDGTVTLTPAPVDGTPPAVIVRFKHEDERRGVPIGPVVIINAAAMRADANVNPGTLGVPFGYKAPWLEEKGWMTQPEAEAIAAEYGVNLEVS